MEKNTSRRGLIICACLVIGGIIIGMILANVFGLKVNSWEDKFATKILKEAGYEFDDLKDFEKKYGDNVNVDLNDLIESKFEDTAEEVEEKVEDSVKNTINDSIDDIFSTNGYKKVGEVSSDLVGYYEVSKVEITNEDGTVETTGGEELQKLKDLGMVVTFEATEDGKAVFNMFGVKMDIDVLDSEKMVITSGLTDLESEDANVNYSLDGDNLLIYDRASKFYFVRAEKPAEVEE